MGAGGRGGKQRPRQVDHGESQNDKAEIGAGEFAKGEDEPFAPASGRPLIAISGPKDEC